MSNPYRIEGPALISFSGGRTSGFMLHEIVRAHDGRLPDDIVVCFANTGKEREETLRFVHECGTRWNVRIHWLEWRDNGDGFEEVGFNSASRAGEPFTAMIAKRNYLPNAVTRYCTTQLKIRPMSKFVRSLGWQHWNNVVGLRYDEGMRVLKQIDRNAQGKERYTTLMPMAKARHTKADVMAFWEQQPFDLQLRSYEGNCDLCFLKARAKLSTLIRENPGMADWWIEQERNVRPDKPAGARFVTEYSYAQLARECHAQGHLFDGFMDDDEHDTECGLMCAPMQTEIAA